MASESEQIDNRLYFETDDALIKQKRKKATRRKYIIGGIVVVVLLGVAAGLIAYFVTEDSDDSSDSPAPATTTTTPAPMPEEDLVKLDCYPEANSPQEELTKEKCEARGCIYEPSDFAGVPDCYVDVESTGFEVVSPPSVLTTTVTEFFLRPKNSMGMFGQQFENVSFKVEMIADHILHFSFDDANDTSRFKVPLPLNLTFEGASNPMYSFELYNDTSTFAFKIKRISTGTVIWDTGVGGLVLSDQYLQIATKLPSENIYGFGENVHESFKHDLNFRAWPLWARDQPPGVGHNLYSVHPFYECLEDDVGNAHGVLLFNLNAMDYALTPAPMLTYRTVGGILDFYVFMGPSLEEVVQQYTEVIGRTYLPPYWSLGFHLSRYGYLDTSDIRGAVDRTVQNNIPLDVQYADIDHMTGFRNFELNETHFGDLPEYFNELRSGGMKTIIVLDPPLEINDTYKSYQYMSEDNLFVKWPDVESMPPGDYEEYNNTNMMGSTWPRWKVVFPDFLNDTTNDIWMQLVVEHFNDTIQFDGLWLDMNEPANFDTNGVEAWNWPEHLEPWALNCTYSKWDDPPYRPLAAYHWDSDEKYTRLSDKTLCMQGVHLGGQLHYNVHNLYGHHQTIATLRAVREAVGGNKRSVVITRSTVPGTGSYSGRWLGDNVSNWPDLRYSIIGMLEFNLFGIPYVGADICGFFEDTTEELCLRWMQVGAFYPFARNHNGIGFNPQDPGYLGDNVIKASRDALNTRYTLLPYLYTLFYKSHTQGSTVARPLVHEFSTDTNTWNIDRQFLWGAALLISPILDQNVTELTFYLPNATWYNYYNGERELDEGKHVTMGVELETPIFLHLRGGHIIPTQQPANNTQHSRRNPFGLLVALDKPDGAASGEMFWDDGESIDTYATDNYAMFEFTSEANILQYHVIHDGMGDNISHLVMGEIRIMGVSFTPDYITVTQDNNTHNVTFTYNSQIQVLTMNETGLVLNKDFTVEWRRISTNGTEGKLDCCPELGCDRTKCEAKGCLWRPAEGLYYWCIIDSSAHGYRVVNSSNDTMSRLLSWKGLASMYGGDIDHVVVLREDYGHTFRVKFYDPAVTRFEVPVPLTLPNTTDSSQFELSENHDPYGFTLRRSTGELIWDTTIGGLTIADQFSQIGAFHSCRNMHGFGEHLHSSLKHDYNYHIWPMFTRDQPPNPQANLYSVHPFYMCIEETGKAHGVFFFNSNAMEVQLLPDPAILYRTIGGVLDFYFIVGDTPEEVIQRYTKMTGLPHIPPYWALGFHLSRYGYNNLQNIIDAINRTVSAEIPFDVQHMDIDTMDERKTFTVDPVLFENLGLLVDDIKERGMRTMMISNPFLISNETNYAPYDIGLEKDLFIKWPEGLSPDYEIYENNNLLAWCWPKGRVVYPDFFHVNSSEYWQQLILDYINNTLHVDGFWLDMNDPAAFGTNEERPFNWPEDERPYWSLKCPVTNYDDPPYKPISIWGPRLSDKTICLSSLQNENQTRHYDLHSLHGWSQTIPTLRGIQRATGERGMVVSRSTYPSSGKYAGHWLGDNGSTWSSLRESIIGILEFNLFGVPFVGADICGYFGDTTEELCTRWTQLGAFYTFARNHNGLDYIEQDPAYFGNNSAAAAKKVLEIRYSLLPYLYTLFYHAHVDGGTVIRSLAHEFSTDNNTYNIDTQFMWGSALLISPVLYEQTFEVSGYVPHGRWFDYYTGEELTEVGALNTFSAPWDVIPLHLRSGYIIPTQAPANTTYYSRKNSLGLLVMPDDNNTAAGNLFWDDGVSIDTVENGTYYTAAFHYTVDELTIAHNNSNVQHVAGLVLDTVRVHGVEESPVSVSKASGGDCDFSHNATNKVLEIFALNHAMEKEETLEFRY